MVKKTKESKSNFKTYDKEEIKKEVIENKTKNEKKKNVKKLLIIIFSIILFVAIVTCTIIFIIIKVPSKYCGTYVRYTYMGGDKGVEIYKIKPLSITHTVKYKYADEEYNKTEKLKYEKNGKDLIVEGENEKNYIILDDDKIYVTDSKDISFEKKYNMYFYNEKSDKKDIYEMRYEAEKFEDQLEYSVRTWSRELVYKSIGKEIDKDNTFYIFESDEKSDESDLNSYSVEYEIGNGKLTLNFSKKTKRIKSISYYAHVSMSEYYNDPDSATVEDIYDSKAVLLSSMAILYSNGKYDDSLSKDENKNLVYHTVAAFDYDDLYKNKTEGKNGTASFSLYNERYDVSFNDDLSITDYSVLGGVRWSIRIK